LRLKSGHPTVLICPIENVWAFNKDELYKVRGRLHTDDVWIEAVRIWNYKGVDEVMRHLDDTMPNQIRELIKKKGHPIDY